MKITSDGFFMQNKLKFDCVFIIGDRFEKLAEVNNSIVFNKPIIHYSGGEETAGVIDDQVRHMITKSAHLHFVQCDKYKKNILHFNTNKIFIDDI